MKRSTPDWEDVTIHISTGTMLRVILIGGLFAALWYLRDIILVVLTAIILASAIEPGIKAFGKRNIPRLLVVVLFYVLGGAFLATIFYFFLPAFIGDVNRLLSEVPKLLETSVWSPLSSGLPTSADGGLTATTVLDLFRDNVSGGGALRSASVFFGGFLSFILIVVLSFYLSAQEKGIESFFRLVAPVKERAYVLDLWRRSQTKIGLWFQGQLLLGILVGVLAFLGLTILGVPNALFLAVIMAVFELIPVFGPVMAAVPGIALAFGSGTAFAGPGIPAALMVGVFYFIIQQFESHLIYPLVVRKVIGIPPVLVILALVIGGKLAGILGVLLSVPVTAVLMEFLGDVAKEKKIFEDT